MKTDSMPIDEVSTCLKLKTAHHLAAKGDIPDSKIGGAWRFSRNEIEKWIKWINMQEKRAAS